MKISIIGAGNVGSLTAMRLAEKNFSQIVLIDIVKGLAEGKSLDLEDARSVLKNNYNIQGTDDIGQIKGSDIIIVTAGLARKPGMTREDLLNKNSQILKEVCLNIKKLSPESIVIIVTNPLDLMTYFALKIIQGSPQRIFGMGLSLDASRFANLVSKELSVAVTDINACVIGSHGEGMLPMPRFSTIKGVSLDKILDKEAMQRLAQRTFDRGKEIVSLLGSGSAYFAPSAAIADIVEAIVSDQKRTIGLCAYLNGEYGLKDISIGVPCCLGKSGIEKIVELDLNKEEKDALLQSASQLKQQYNGLFL